jgi:hypothetical protein
MNKVVDQNFEVDPACVVLRGFSLMSFEKEGAKALSSLSIKCKFYKKVKVCVLFQLSRLLSWHQISQTFHAG